MFFMTTTLPQARVGHTSLQVSVLGLGTAPLGNLGKHGKLAQATALDIVQHSLAQGIRFIDTAPIYGAGIAERWSGEAVAETPRASYVLATKIGRLIQPDAKARADYSRDGVLRSIEDSLQRLKLDRVDIVHIHDADNDYRQALDEAFPTLAELRRQGVIGAIGAGMNQWQMEAEFARNADFDCFLLAGRYTLLEQGALDEFLPLCQQKGISVFLGGVYNSGVLARGAHPDSTYNYAPAPPSILERVRRLEDVCQRHQVPLYVAALQFPKAHPAVTSLIVGAESPQEVDRNLEALRYPIPAALWDELRSEGLLHEAAPVPQG